MYEIKKLPQQPLYVNEEGTIRFVPNKIVEDLLDFATPLGFDMNHIAKQAIGYGKYTPEEQMQFAQLIGYSLSGYGELSYVTDDSYDDAVLQIPQKVPLKF